jgi:hypothetical protein
VPKGQVLSLAFIVSYVIKICMKYESKIAKIDALKSELDTYRPLPPEILKQLKEYFRICLTYGHL